MHLLAENSAECEFLLEVLGAHFGVWRELERQYEDSDSERYTVVLGLQQVASILDQIFGYQEAYPETKGNYFYTELNFDQAERLLQSFDVFVRLKKNKLSAAERQLLDKYRGNVEEFVRQLSPDTLDADYVRLLFEEYERELFTYCQLAVAEHVNSGNKAVYVCALQYFPGHHYQLVTMNTVESMHKLCQGDPFVEAATRGFESELYNPACFDVECSCPDSYSAVEQRVRQLYIQFFYLTNDESERSFPAGSPEYANIKQLKALADELFIEASIKVLNQVDFSPLNQSENFCAIVASHELSSEDFYRYAKRMIAPERFAKIFPNADRVEEDYIDLQRVPAKEAAQYMVRYIRDFYFDEVPEGRYYCRNKVYEYSLLLGQYPVLVDDCILTILEHIVEKAKPNPNNPQERCFISMFSKEGALFSDLLRVLAGYDEFAIHTQKRLIDMYKKVIVGMRPCVNHPSFAHRDLAFAISQTDREKYPELDCDFETSYLKNIEDYCE